MVAGSYRTSSAPFEEVPSPAHPIGPSGAMSDGYPRQDLSWPLQQSQAHVGLARAIAGYPAALGGHKVDRLTHRLGTETKMRFALTGRQGQVELDLRLAVRMHQEWSVPSIGKGL
jgi:hypothetical protein